MDYKIYIKEQADQLSVVGLKHCYEKQKSTPVKVIWLFLVIIGVIIAVVLIYDRISNFLSFPVTTTYEIAPQTSIDFPSITICTTNRISKKKVKKYGILKIKKFKSIHFTLVSVRLFSGLEEYFKKFLPPFYLNDDDPEIPPLNVTYTRELRDELSPDIYPLVSFKVVFYQAEGYMHSLSVCGWGIIVLKTFSVTFIQTLVDA